MNLKDFIVSSHQKINLKNKSTDFTECFGKKEEVKEKLSENIELLSKLQDLFYANDTYSLLMIFQGMDTAGKDGVIRHVMSGINPQGVQVFSFKEPSSEELDHDYLWRSVKALPEIGRIGIFNRSYYEEVLITRVRPEVLAKQKLPGKPPKKIWKHRYEDINHWEQYLTRNGVIILKFFLNISKKEQKKRLLERIDNSDKNWKFSAFDLENRKYWNQYMHAYQDMLNHTSSDWAPWHIIPSDHKWFARILVANIIIAKLKSLNLSYPQIDEEQKRILEKYRQLLKKE